MVIDLDSKKRTLTDLALTTVDSSAASGLTLIVGVGFRVDDLGEPLETKLAMGNQIQVADVVSR